MCYVLLHDPGILLQYNSTASSIAAQWSTASGESKTQQADNAGSGGGIVGRRLSSTEAEEAEGTELGGDKGDGGRGERKGGGWMDGLFQHVTEGEAVAASAQHGEEVIHNSGIDTSLLTAEERWILRTGGG